MRVAVNTRFLLPGNQLEGIGRFSYETLSRLVHQHPEVTFHFLFDRAYDPRYVFASNVVPHVLYPSARHPLLFVAWFEGAVAAWLAQHRPAVFLSLDGFSTLCTRVPRVTVVHDLAFAHYPLDMSWAQRSYYRFFVPRVVRASARLVAVSEATRADVVQRYGVAPERISVACNAPAERFVPRGREAQARTRAQYAGGQPYFLFVGALHPRKNLANLLRAFDQFKQQHGPAAAEVRLLVVGRRAWRAGPIFEAFQQMQHQQAVEFTGRVSDEVLAELYAAALATVFVPFLEGFGIPVVEAQASGCPVLTSAVSSLPEVAGPGAALLVDPHRPADIASGLGLLWADAALRAQLIERGLANVRRFSWERSAAVLWEAVQAAAGSGAGPA